MFWFMKIKLSNGKHSIIDNEDLEKIIKYKWFFDGRYAKTHVKIEEKRKILYMHRIILEGKEIDHINGDKLDNRKCNLRVCDRSLNNLNKNSQKNSLSKFKGAYKHHGKIKKWRSAIGFLGKSLHLGTFFTEIEAAQAYNKKAVELYGEFAKLNKL